MEAKHRDELIEAGYNPHEIALTDSFIELASLMIATDASLAAQLRRGIDKMAAEMNSVLPELEENNKTRGVPLSAVAPLMEPIEEQAVAEFMQITGTIMALAADGPMATALPLKRAVGQLVEVFGS